MGDPNIGSIVITNPAAEAVRIMGSDENGDPVVVMRWEPPDHELELRIKSGQMLTIEELGDHLAEVIAPAMTELLMPYLEEVGDGE